MTVWPAAGQIVENTKLSAIRNRNNNPNALTQILIIKYPIKIILFQSIHLNYLFILCSRWDPINSNIDNKNHEVPTCSLCEPIFYDCHCKNSENNEEWLLQLFHLSSCSWVITFYVIWVMTSQDGHGILTKLKIMHIFGLTWPNWLIIRLLT